MHPGSRGIRVLTPVTVMCAVVSVSLAWALPAHAQPAGVTINPPNPVAGDTVKANGPARECVSNAAGTYTFTFTRHNSDGSQTVTASGSGTCDNTLGGLDYSATLSQEGAYTIKEDTYCRPTMHHVLWTLRLHGRVRARRQHFGVSRPAGRQPVGGRAVPVGGNPGYSYSWDLNNDGTFGDAVTHNPTTTFTTTGPHVVKVRITDNDQHNPLTHTTTITRRSMWSRRRGPHHRRLRPATSGSRSSSRSSPRPVASRRLRRLPNGGQRHRQSSSTGSHCRTTDRPSRSPSQRPASRAGTSPPPTRRCSLITSRRIRATSIGRWRTVGRVRRKCSAPSRSPPARRCSDYTCVARSRWSSGRTRTAPTTPTSP